MIEVKRPYIIVRETFNKALELSVNEFIQQGYIPVGGMVFSPDAKTPCQAMALKSVMDFTPKPASLEQK